MFKNQSTVSPTVSHIGKDLNISQKVLKRSLEIRGGHLRRSSGGGSLRRNYFLAIALAPQLFLKGCADACAASILAILSASAIQIRFGMIIVQSNVIKVKKKH